VKSAPLLLCLLLLAACAQPLIQLRPSPPPFGNNTLLPPTLNTTSAKAQLQSILNSTKKSDFTVVYAVITTVENESQRGDLTLFVRGDDVRSDERFAVAGLMIERRSFFPKAGDAVFCTKENQTWECFSTSSQLLRDSGGDTFANTLKEADAAFWSHTLVTELPARTIARQQARCFALTTTTPDGQIEQSACYSDGIPLLVETTLPGGSMRQEATSFRPSVAADAFVPPAKPEPLNLTMVQ
jgi:hypothetical protein